MLRFGSSKVHSFQKKKHITCSHAVFAPVVSIFDLYGSINMVFAFVFALFGSINVASALVFVKCELCL